MGSQFVIEKRPLEGRCYLRTATYLLAGVVKLAWIPLRSASNAPTRQTSRCFAGRRLLIATALLQVRARAHA